MAVSEWTRAAARLSTFARACQKAERVSTGDADYDRGYDAGTAASGECLEDILREYGLWAEVNDDV